MLGRPRALDRLLAPAVVVACACVQFAPALAGRVYRFEDIAGYFEPLWTAAARAMRDGRFLTAHAWDGGAWSGQPLDGDPQSGMFYPLNWIWLVLPVLRAYSLSVAFHAGLAGVGMYGLCRARGRSPWAAATGGIALAIGGYVVLQTRHVMFVQATAWIPIVAFCATRFLDGGSRLHLAGAAAATGLLFCTGGESMIYYGAFFVAAIVAPRALTDRHETADPGPSVRTRARRLLLLCVAAFLGLALAAPALLAAAAHARLSPRAVGTEYEFAASCAWSGFHVAPSLFLPNLLGDDARGTYLGGCTQWEIAGYYCGILPFALAMYGLARGPRRDRAERIALGALLLFAVLVAPGARSPVHALAYRLLPLYGAMRCPPRALYVFALAVPLYAAAGLDLVRDQLGAMLRRNNAVEEAMLRRSMLTLSVVLPLAVPLATAVDLLATHRAENPSITLAEAHAREFPAVERFLREHVDADRGDRFINDVHLPHALHASGLSWGLDAASGYSSLPLWRYLHLLYIVDHGRTYPWPRLRDDLAAPGIWRFDSPVVDLLAIRWVLAPRGWEPRATGFARRYVGAPGPGEQPAVDVWENTEALPRAYLASHVRRASSPAEAAALVAAAHNPRDAGADGATRGGVDLSREAVVEDDAPGERGLVPPDLTDGAPAPFEPVARITRPAPAAIEARVSLPSTRLLVFAEPMHPGWRATIDGAGARVLPVDYALTGVIVPAGEHVVRLSMTAPATEKALWAAAAASLCIAAIALSGLRRGTATATATRRDAGDGFSARRGEPASSPRPGAP